MHEESVEKVQDLYEESIEWLAAIAQDTDKANVHERLEAIQGIHTVYNNNVLLKKLEQLKEDMNESQKETANKLKSQIDKLKPKRPEWMGDEEDED